MRNSRKTGWQAFFFIILLAGCQGKNSAPSPALIAGISLKRGDIISCGSPDKQFGQVDFAMSCDEKTKKDFNTAVALLHSFEYDESEKMFAKIIDESPACAMAYWGVAMSNFHPLWNPPTEAELKKGSKAIELAKTISNTPGRELAYINAIAAFYQDWATIDHRTRCLNFEKAMEQLHTSYPDDKEGAIFYALALDAAADPSDKTYTRQKKAATILNTLYPNEPDHPGIIHYIIHTNDYPGLATLALPAARKYAQIAPSSAHALHMPSHIFTRLGLWDECIESNKSSISAAKCYAEAAGIKGHWDEELHGLDYLVYAYLQKGENSLANEQLHYLESMKVVYPVNFKVAYAFAAIPSRVVLENKNWAGAAALQVRLTDQSWAKFPWQEAIIHFTRLLGAAHLNKQPDAKLEWAKLKQLYDTLQQQKDVYKSRQVAIQLKAGEAWMLFESGKTNDALNLMRLAAAMEDSTEKHPVTPGEVLPARELLADMLLQANQYEEALQAYEAVLIKCPNRFNSLYGAGLVAKKMGKKEKAVSYFKQLIAITGVKAERPELELSQAYVKL